MTDPISAAPQPSAAYGQESVEAPSIELRLAQMGFDEPTVDRMIGLWGAGATEKLLDQELEKGEIEQPATTLGDRVPGRPRTSVPATRLYFRLIRELGPPSAPVRLPGPPDPARAWLEIQRQRGAVHPTFSHPMVAEALEALGGYLELPRHRLDRARKEYMAIYRDLAGGAT